MQVSSRIWRGELAHRAARPGNEFKSLERHDDRSTEEAAARFGAADGTRNSQRLDSELGTAV